MRSSVRVTWKGGLPCWGPWRIGRKGSGDGHLFSIGALLGNLGSCTEDLERWMKGALGKELLSLKRLSAEDLEGGLLYWGPWVMKGGLWGWASLFIGAQLGSMEWVHLPGTLRDGWKGLWRWGISLSLSLSLWELCEGNMKGGFAGDPEG